VAGSLVALRICREPEGALRNCYFYGVFPVRGHDPAAVCDFLDAVSSLDGDRNAVWLLTKKSASLADFKKSKNNAF
jgi:hypothetical protein